MKRYILFAGVNGAGKTTLYQSVSDYKEIPRVNMDEIVRKIGSWKNSKDVAKAGMIATRKIRNYLNEGLSFNQETTLCGKSIIYNINKAKELGYEVILFYIGLDNVEIAKKRVAQRVLDGGHGIPEVDIVRRYTESLNNLKKIILVCDYVKIYDNTVSFVKVASFVDGKCVDKSDYIPKWLRDTLNIV